MLNVAAFDWALNKSAYAHHLSQDACRCEMSVDELFCLDGASSDMQLPQTGSMQQYIMYEQPRLLGPFSDVALNALKITHICAVACCARPHS